MVGGLRPRRLLRDPILPIDEALANEQLPRAEDVATDDGTTQPAFPLNSRVRVRDRTSGTAQRGHTRRSCARRDIATPNRALRRRGVI